MSRSAAIFSGPLASRFARLNEEQRQHLSAAMQTRQVAAKSTLVEEGGDSGVIYLMASGWAFRHQTRRSGSRQIVGLVLPGDVCNLDALAFARADYGVRMLTSGTLLAIAREDAIGLGARHSRISELFGHLALLENAILCRWALCLGRLSAQERLAHLLCEIAARLGCEGAGSFDLPLTQDQIADTLGLTAVHVNRVLQQLRGQGVIAISGKSMTILDYLGLRAIGDFDPAYLHRGEIEGDHTSPRAREPGPRRVRQASESLF